MAGFVQKKQTKKTYNNILDIIEIREYRQLESELKKYIFNKKELREIEIAYQYAYEKHDGQLRRNGDPYIYHPLSTAYYLAQLKMGPKTIIAGLLHDILEDTPYTVENIEEKFGSEVANLVESVTKVSYFAKENREQLKSEYLRKLYLSMAKDIRVIIIKIADRLHNMLTIRNLPEAKQIIIARETLDIYSAIAHRIGMKNAKSFLEDMSFEVLNPLEYQKTKELMDSDREKRTQNINAIISDIDLYLRKEKHIKLLDIFGRAKTVYSVYRKMNMVGKQFEEINDVLAIRIITKSIDDCYKILGFIHQKYTPLAKRFKDYIATPKNNVYQSLHTTLADNSGSIFEVQIRTEAMDEIAETGAASHWRYKEGEVTDIAKKQKEIDEQIDIFNRILDLDRQTSVDDNSSIKESIENTLKEDLFTASIYVLTPGGAVKTLPYGSTVLDFAYRIHTEVGEKTIGAKINGVFSPINTVLKSGEVVEIKTSSKQEPTHEWLKIVVTAAARNRIKKYLSAKMTDENIKDKKEENRLIAKKVEATINAYINQKDWRWKRKSNDEILESVKKLGFATLEDFLLAQAKGDYTIAEATDLVYIDKNYSKDDEALENIKSKVVNNLDLKNDIVIDGITNIKTSLASCCMPIPYEDVVGYVSKGSGIKVHLKECFNISNPEDQKRLIAVQWNSAVAETHFYTTKICYYGIDRPNLIYDVSKVLTSLKASIINANIATDEKLLTCSGVLTIKIKNSDQLNQIISAIKSIPSINEVERGYKKR
ncbi:bifunctional (p)ppGpp synthetase/guanosine-3',5'-bis(diphosphate) 3'-pyrophosphohydrolase [Mesoplasma syrphidae]|uniref:Penta-phosphate guanosine-3'-pyrophosphohydrolase n=1 Tax=Mesoplasma syrphidae TaxID=225999 RepID=A0A2K9BZ13_9MOLU|nr:RelA/SpoT family protein [Mesoplasma syrphidae]AUF83608.1 bifunctional (p)ppGpp synthetase/guanosine-3',5'-bis(diphosphate) 3'-pyrophosphohydrolase [Mesoplasma syrphidae]